MGPGRPQAIVSIEGADLRWVDDDHVVALAADRRSVSVRAVAQSAVALGTLEVASAANSFSLLNDASGAPLVFEAGESQRLLRVAVTGGVPDWSEIPSRLQLPPAAVSVAGNVALFFNGQRSAVLLRSVDRATVLARLVGQERYTAAALSPGGDLVGLVGRGPECDPDVYVECEGRGPRFEAAVEVFRFADGSRWHWGNSTETEFLAR